MKNAPFEISAIFHVNRKVGNIFCYGTWKYSEIKKIHLFGKIKRICVGTFFFGRSHWDKKISLLYPRSPKGEGGILFYLCPSVRPSKIFFVTFFSVTVDDRNLIFCHKHHIGIPYCG